MYVFLLIIPNHIHLLNKNPLYRVGRKNYVRYTLPSEKLQVIPHTPDKIIYCFKTFHNFTQIHNIKPSSGDSGDSCR